jgi:acyl carrier protein
VIDLRGEVYRLLADQFCVDRDDITDKIGPGDFPAWNSLGHLQLMLMLERRFEVRFSADDILSFEDVGDLVALVERKVGERGGQDG